MVLFWPADRHDRLDIVALDLHSSPLVLGQCMKSSSPGDNENYDANVGIGDPQFTTTWESLGDGHHCYNDDDDLYSIQNGIVLARFSRHGGPQPIQWVATAVISSFSLSRSPYFLIHIFGKRLAMLWEVGHHPLHLTEPLTGMLDSNTNWEALDCQACAKIMSCEILTYGSSQTTNGIFSLMADSPLFGTPQKFLYTSHRFLPPQN